MLYFSNVFGVDKHALDQYGAFSNLNDLKQIAMASKKIYIRPSTSEQQGSEISPVYVPQPTRPKK